MEHLTCDCPVLGLAERSHRPPRRPVAGAVGKLSQAHHNLYPTSTKLFEKKPLRVVSYKVDLGGRTLRWLVERLDKRHTYYLSGEMRVGSKLGSRTSTSTGRPTSMGRWCGEEGQEEVSRRY